MTVDTSTGLVGGRGRFSVVLASLLLLLAVAACTGAPAVTPAGTPAVTVELGADDLAFDKSELRVPAGVPFAIHFENRESPPHNVSIHSSAPVFVGETFGGPAERTYFVPALAAGDYTFLCDLHPNMRGTLTAGD